MIVVTGIATVAPESAEALKAAARKMAAASREEAGCHAYAFYEDLEVAGRFRVYEEWESAEALREHFATPHMKSFNAAIREARDLHIDISQFERGPDIKVG